MNNDGIKALMTAVVIQAIRDYRLALRGYNTARSLEIKQEHKNMIGACELFFREDIGAYSDLDGEKILVTVQKNVREEFLKKGIAMRVPQ